MFTLTPQQYQNHQRKVVGWIETTTPTPATTKQKMRNVSVTIDGMRPLPK